MGQVAIYPGSFDPVTKGHLDLIQRATQVFEKVIVAAANNSANNAVKTTLLFNIDERLDMLREATKGIKGIEVESFSGLVIDYARRKNVHVLIRGLRMISDFEYELQMALTNRRLATSIETVFLMPSENYSFLSSTLLKETASLGADISTFVPDFVAKRLQARLATSTP